MNQYIIQFFAKGYWTETVIIKASNKYVALIKAFEKINTATGQQFDTILIGEQ